MAWRRTLWTIVRRTGKGIAWTIGSVLVLVLVMVAVVLWTPWGTRTALTFALDRYDAFVPGGIGVDAVSGTLGGTLELDALELHDGDDNPLLTAEHVRLELRLLDLLRGTLGFDMLAVQSLVVHTGGEAAKFADLGPDTPSKPKPDGMVGPDLPLGFEGAIAVDGITILQHAEDGSSKALVDSGIVRATLSSKGREAAVRIDALSAVVGGDAIAISAMQGDVAWADPVVSIDGLAMVSDRGILHATSVALDAHRMHGDATVHGIVDVAQLAPDSELPIHGLATVEVHAAGGEDVAWADIVVAAEPDARVALVLGGTLVPILDMSGVGIVQLVPPGAKTTLQSAVVASIVRPKDQPMYATLRASCLGCDGDVGAEVVARTDADGTETRLAANVRVADTTVNASATIRDRVLARARAGVDIPSAARVRRVLAPYIAMPQITGSATAAASCRGAEARLDCTADVLGRELTYAEGRIDRVTVDAAIALRDGKPSGDVLVRGSDMRWQKHRVDAVVVSARGNTKHVDVALEARAPQGRAELAAVIEPGPRTRIGLHALELDYRRLRKGRTLHVRLARPSHATIGKGGASVDELRLLVDKGAIAMAGTVGAHSDATLAIEHLNLASFDPLELPVRLRGMVEARADFRGRPADPKVALIMDADRLEIDDHVLGRIGTDVSLDHGRVDARIDWEPEPKQSVELRARASLRAFDDPRGPGLVASAPLLVSLRAEDLPLSRLEPWIGEHSIDGRLDATFDISGTAARPKIAASIDGNGLAFDEARLDDLQVRFGHDAGRVDLAVTAEAPWLDELELVASAPVRVAGVAPYYTLDRRGRASIDLTVDELELAGLRGVVPELDVTGRIDVDVAAEVDRGRIEGAHAELLAQDLSRKGDRIVTLSFAADVGPDRAHGKLQASGPAVRLLEAEIDVPLAIDVAELEAKWRRTDEHTVLVEIAEADLAAIGRLTGIGGMFGRLGGTASLVGSPSAPKVDVDLHGHRLAWSGHGLGEVDIEVHHDAGRIDAKVQQRDGAQSLEVVADLPIAIDLASGGAKWNEADHHVLEVDAIAIDQDLLAAFVTLPDDLAFEINAEVHARGKADALVAQGRVRAYLVDDEGIDTPLAASFDVRPDAQRLHVVIGPFEDSAIELTALAKAPLAKVLSGEPVDWKAVSIDAALETDHFPLGGLASVLPDALADPAGRMDVHFAAVGTLGKPDLRGSAQIRGGAITVVPMRQRFDRLVLDASLDHQDFKLTKLSARSGSGTARASGELHLERGATKGKLEVVLAGLPIVRPGMPLMKLSTHTTAVLDATGKRTDIDVVAKRSTLDVFTASATAPKVLPTEEGIVYTDVANRIARAEKTKAAKEPLLPPDMHVRLELGDPIYVRGPQANMTWRGSVDVERTAGQKVRAHGALVADRGRINFLGRDFVVDSGRVTLPEQGDLDPYIALTAVTQTEEGAVTIDVHGRASRPELRLSSDPPMPESDVFALLVTGSSGGAEKESEGGGEAGAVEAKAATLLAAFQNPVLQRELQDRVGIDRVGVSFGDTIDQPIVAVGKRVSRKVYLETRYHHNAPQFENTAEVHLEYSIKPPRWTIETFIGDAAKGGVEVWWRKRFGKAKEAKVEKVKNTAKTRPAKRMSSTSGQ